MYVYAYRARISLENSVHVFYSLACNFHFCAALLYIIFAYIEP